MSQLLGDAKEAYAGSRHDFDAASVTSPAESQQIREAKRDLVRPLRWVDTDKDDGKFTEDGAPKP